MKRWIVALQGLFMLIISAGAAVNFLDFRFIPAFAYSGWGLTCLGLILVAISVFTLNRNLTIWVEPRAELVTHGIFRFSRNPIYLGGLLMCAGWTLMFLSWVCALGTIGLAFVLNKKIQYEEHALAGKFGKSYTDYCRRTPRWLYL